jgi:hypothetical protein
MVARNRVDIGLSYRPARLQRLAELIPLYRFLGSVKVQKFGLRLHRLAESIPRNRFLGIDIIMKILSVTHLEEGFIKHFHN